jgi:hypothetical protein
MTPDDINRLIAKYHFKQRTAQAIQFHLSGLTRADAARMAGIHPSILTRAMARVEKVTICEHCGSRVKVLDI